MQKWFPLKYHVKSKKKKKKSMTPDWGALNEPIEHGHVLFFMLWSLEHLKDFCTIVGDPTHEVEVGMRANKTEW